jgi:hypothetical protein
MMADVNGNGGTKYRLDNLDTALANIFNRLHELETGGCVLGKVKMENIEQKLQAIQSMQEKFAQKQEKQQDQLKYYAGGIAVLIFVFGVLLRIFV